MTFRTIALAATFALAAIAANAEIIEVEVPDSTERVLFDLPAGWSKVFTDEKNSGGVRTIIHEYVPDGQTEMKWDEMITVLLVRPVEAPDEEHHFNTAKVMTMKFYSDLCIARPERMMVPKETRNGFPTALFFMYCVVRPEAKAARPGLVRNLESLIGVSMTGRNGWSYQVQRAWHTDELEDDGKAGLKGSPAKRAELEAAQDAMVRFAQKQVVACDTADPAKPCTLPAQ
ncbi:MAG: hypothetical protein Q8J92_03825 [Parvibaculum sp.]|nr:hypothetical protein [Parvibaculum sp.]